MAVHETARDLYRAGAIDIEKMREFDQLCLGKVETLTPEEIRELRQREQTSQAIFAEQLHVSVSLVSQWERGKKKPSGPSLKLLNLVKQKGLKYLQP